jgi:WD40 repeat protein
VWDAWTGEPISPPLPHRDAALHAIFSPDGRRLATLASSGEMRIWNAATGEPITMPIPHAHRHDLGRLSFSPDGKRLLVATGADEVRLYDLTPESGSVTELRLRAQLLSGKRFDSAGSITPLDSASLSNVWRELRARLEDR